MFMAVMMNSSFCSKELGVFSPPSSKCFSYNDDPSKWTLIFVGDLVNKGPKSAECVKFARESGALCVRGNHDDACLATYMRVGRYKDLPPDEYP
ncbi:unnamed protein product, partial [Heterosigma akashiwo]